MIDTVGLVAGTASVL